MKKTNLFSVGKIKFWKENSNLLSFMKNTTDKNRIEYKFKMRYFTFAFGEIKIFTMKKGLIMGAFMVLVF